MRPKAGPSTLTLSQLNWAFNYPASSYDDYPGIEHFISEKGWKHNKEYPKALTIKFWDEKFPEYIAEIALQESAGRNGIMLDWWRDSGDVLKFTGLTKSQMRQHRTKLVKAIRGALGPDKIILGNVGWDLNPVTTKYINGVFFGVMEKTRSGTIHGQ